MIAIDTSSIIALLQREPQADQIEIILADNTLCMSAGTYAELCIVAHKRNMSSKVKQLLFGLSVEIVPVDYFMAEKVVEAHATYSTGKYGLNFGDCFSYALAKERNIPLLFVGKDFPQTDLDSVLS